MEIMFFLLPIAIILGASFVFFFIWATRSGQYDDLDSPAKRILFEENISMKDYRKGQKK